MRLDGVAGQVLYPSQVSSTQGARAALMSAIFLPRTTLARRFRGADPSRSKASVLSWNDVRGGTKS